MNGEAGKNSYRQNGMLEYRVRSIFSSQSVWRTLRNRKIAKMPGGGSLRNSVSAFGRKLSLP